MTPKILVIARESDASLWKETFKTLNVPEEDIKIIGNPTKDEILKGFKELVEGEG